MLRNALLPFLTVAVAAAGCNARPDKSQVADDNYPAACNPLSNDPSVVATCQATWKKFVDATLGMLPKDMNKDQVKKLLDYFQLNEVDRNALQNDIDTLENLTPEELGQLISAASTQAIKMASVALLPALEESLTDRPVRPLTLPEPTSSLPQQLVAEVDSYNDAAAGVLYSKHVADRNEGASPIAIGGGFPFNQAQFASFNDQLARVAPVDLYDPICNGMSVLYDSAANNGNTCRPYAPTTPADALRDEFAFRIAHLVVTHFALAPAFDPVVAVFRLTRVSFRGVTLAEQARATHSISERQGYQKGESLFAGISYGGLIGAKVGMMYPGEYKALVLFSPGVENPAHVNDAAAFSYLMEGSASYRNVLHKIVHDIAYSPRYTDYRPLCLANYDEGFRDSLQSKMLGEMDMDAKADLKRVKDRVYIITAARDTAVAPATQIEAMRVIFSKPEMKGSYVLVPNGSHALWGNPKQSVEDAVLQIFKEIEAGPNGLFRDGGVYLWDPQGTNGPALLTLGQGLDGLDRASAIIAAIQKPQHPDPQDADKLNLWSPDDEQALWTKLRELNIAP